MQLAHHHNGKCQTAHAAAKGGLSIMHDAFPTKQWGHEGACVVGYSTSIYTAKSRPCLLQNLQPLQTRHAAHMGGCAAQTHMHTASDLALHTTSTASYAQQTPLHDEGSMPSYYKPPILNVACLGQHCLLAGARHMHTAHARITKGIVYMQACQKPCPHNPRQHKHFVMAASQQTCQSSQ
jgi:hypothetical protein